ncbi:MAG: hypothetical protein IJ661_07740 [Lachnospiraceae bacterium]|nr:hypothetical protein [Lachnospiraceae bacterium]
MENNSDNNILYTLKQKYNKCKDQPALATQILYVIKLQNELTKINGYSFHSYEKTIFERAMQIFISHFIEQIDIILEMDNENGKQERNLTEKKHAYIKDVQDAVEKMVEIFQNMVGSIKNVDQPLFPTMSDSMYVFDASPKILTFYSRMLNKLAEILDNSEQYVFLLYPAMTDIIYTDVLFQKRDVTGKVIIVTFPESLIEHPGVIPILFHEAFHVVERNYRYRKLRAQCYWENMCHQIETSIFYGLDDLSYSTNKSCQKATRVLLQPMLDEFFSWLRRVDKTERALYAHNLNEVAGQKFRLALMDFDDKVYDVDINKSSKAFKDIDEWNFKNYCKAVETHIARKLQIRKNIVQIFSYDSLRIFGESFMDIYREGYADIASCLFLNLSVSDYDAAFELSCQFSVPNKEYEDRERVVRQYVVSNALSKVGPEEQRMKWKEKSEKCLERISHWTVVSESEKGVVRDEDMKMNIVLDNEILKSYNSYFEKVAMELDKHFSKVLKAKNVVNFRTLVKDAMSLKESVMLDVFLGTIEL